jgi:hypothetical protein
MNHLEKKMRYSNAFSSLNSLRNVIEFDGPSVMDSIDKNIILDAIEIAIDTTEESFTKALMFGFYNTGDTIKASALELAKVISDGLGRNVIEKEEIDNIRNILRSDISLFDNRLELIKKVDNLMILLNKAKREDVPIANTLLIKNFNLL